MQQGSSQDDPLGWMTMMVLLSPNTAPKQKEAASTMYQLFAPQDGDYSYHGLNFAAYGGKVNRFSGEEEGSNQMNNNGLNDVGLIDKYGFKYVPISSIYDSLNEDELNYNMNNEGMTLREYYNAYPTAKVAVNDNGRIVTANDLRELEQRSLLSNTEDFAPENWLSLRVERPDGTKYDQSDIDVLNSHRKEYRDIELASKQNQSWLKMPNGSTWNGDPRIWIMMQSDAFNKNYRQQPWYTGQAEWETEYETPDGLTTDKVTRAPYYDDQMWFSNSKLYGDTFADFISEDKMNWRNMYEDQKSVKGKNFISAIPKAGNYRYLKRPNTRTFDRWQSMPYNLINGDIVRINDNEIIKELEGRGVWLNRRKDGNKIHTDDVADWSAELGDDGLFMYQVADGPVVINKGDDEYHDYYLPRGYDTSNAVINEFISQPGFTRKIKFIEGNNGNFDINDLYKYRAFGGILNYRYL